MVSLHKPDDQVRQDDINKAREEYFRKEAIRKRREIVSQILRLVVIFLLAAIATGTMIYFSTQ